MGWCTRGRSRSPQARGVGLVRHDGSVREQSAERVRDGLTCQRSSRPVRATRGLQCGIRPGGPDRVDQTLEPTKSVVTIGGEDVDFAAVRDQVTRLARVGEKGHRCLGADKHKMTDSGQLGRRELGQVGEPLDGWPSGTAFEAGRERLAQQLGPNRICDATGSHEGGTTRRAATDQQRRGLARAQRLGDGVDHVPRNLGGRHYRSGGGRSAGLQP